MQAEITEKLRDQVITFLVMQEPVLLGDGHAYEKEAILQWLEKNQSLSPLTRQQVESPTSYVALQAQIQSLLLQIKANSVSSYTQIMLQDVYFSLNRVMVFRTAIMDENTNGVVEMMNQDFRLLIWSPSYAYQHGFTVKDMDDERNGILFAIEHKRLQMLYEMKHLLNRLGVTYYQFSTSFVLKLMEDNIKDLPTIQALQIFGVDMTVELPSLRTTLLMTSCYSGNLEMAKYLLPLTKDLNQTNRSNNLMHAAAIGGNLGCLKLVMDESKINHVTNEGMTALSLAIEEAPNSMAIVPYLLTIPGIDVNIQEYQDLYTPLMLSIVHKIEDVALLLLDYPTILVNVTDKRGRTALHWAVLKKLHHVVQKLVLVCDCSIKDCSGLTAKEYAESPKIVALFP